MAPDPARLHVLRLRHTQPRRGVRARRADLAHALTLALLALAPVPSLAASAAPQAASKSWREDAESDARGKARIHDLEEFARLGRTAPNGPRPEVVERLAEGFEDPLFTVRAAAARLIGDGQHRASAVAALTEFADRMVEQLRLRADRREALRSGLKALPSGKKFDPQKAMEALGANKAKLDELIALYCEDESDDLVLLDLARSLGRLPDDRSVEALEALMNARPRQASALGAAEQLLRLGSTSAIRAVVGYLEVYGEFRDEADKGLEKLRRQKPRRVPKGQDPRAWKERERARIDREVEARTEQVEVVRAQERELIALLESFASDHDLPAPRNATYWRDWDRWRVTHRERFPESLGTIE